MSRRTIIGLLAAFALGLAVPAALWASPVDDQYGGAPQTPVTSTVGTTTTTTTTTTTSTTDTAATTTSSETPATPVERTVEQAPAATTAGEQQAAAQAGGSPLPFTGLQLGLFVAAGLAATAAGLALRRAGRRRS